MLKFSEWDRIYYSMDESISDDVQNWISRTLGGKISKIDGIVSDLVFLEKEFASEWEKTQMEISSMEGQIRSGEISPEEEESFRKKIKAKNQEMDKLENLKNQKIKALNYKVRDYVDDNPRIIKYWNLKKAEAEVEVAEVLYNLAKNLSDKEVEKELYDAYLGAKEDLRKRREDVYSAVKKDVDPEQEAKSKEEEKNKSEDSGRDIPGIKSLVSMGPSEFISEVGRHSKDSLRKIKKALIERKNQALNDLRALRRGKSRELDIAKPGQKEQILKKYNPKIYEVGEFIDRMREKINYIDGKLNN